MRRFRLPLIMGLIMIFSVMPAFASSPSVTSTVSSLPNLTGGRPLKDISTVDPTLTQDTMLADGNICLNKSSIRLANKEESSLVWWMIRTYTLSWVCYPMMPCTTGHNQVRIVPSRYIRFPKLLIPTTYEGNNIQQ